ncbi:MAG: pentapeptide repeat-containing protein [Candidatus Acidiferrales bacterium]
MELTSRVFTGDEQDATGVSDEAVSGLESSDEQSSGEQSLPADEAPSSIATSPSLADLPADFPREWLEASPAEEISQPGIETADSPPASLVDEPRRDESPKIDSREWELEATLASHREWLDSKGVAGKKADLCAAELEGTELIGVNLRYADLQDANLRAADLLLADLRDTSLIRADLQDSCLVGANLEGANLEGASLAGAMGLVPRQLAGANLRDATIPEPLLKFEAFEAFTAAARLAERYLLAILSCSILSWLVVWKTRDMQLVSDSGLLSYRHVSAGLPTAEFYLIAPVALFILYVVAHYQLQRAWESVLELPAIFPDGEAFAEQGPRIVTALARCHFRWLNSDSPSRRFIEKWSSLLLAYWLVPITLLLYWARYLTRQEIHGTILHILLIIAAVAIAIYSPARVGRPEERWALGGEKDNWFVARWKQASIASVACALAIVLALLSLGTFTGVPHDHYRGQQFGPANIRRWVPTVFWCVGFDPFADLTESSISTPPANWTGADDQISNVRGAHLSGAKFRYAQAYGVFLANSHLWRADFRGAFMSEADLRGADLGQANLSSAVLDQAKFGRAVLDRAALDGTDLTQADLRGANLSYSTLTHASLVDARLDGATLYGARITGANLTRANLEKADLRNAYLDDADLNRADLQQAYLWSAKLQRANLENAQLGGAIFIDADLQDADLRGARFQGTVLNDANLKGSLLDGADLRGALGATASQVCSAKSHLGALLDDSLQTQVEAQCGGGDPAVPIATTPQPVAPQLVAPQS